MVDKNILRDEPCGIVKLNFRLILYGQTLNN